MEKNINFYKEKCERLKRNIDDLRQQMQKSDVKILKIFKRIAEVICSDLPQRQPKHPQIVSESRLLTMATVEATDEAIKRLRAIGIPCEAYWLGVKRPTWYYARLPKSMASYGAIYFRWPRV